MLFLGIDLGTSYFKAGVFDESGKMVGLGRVAVKKNIIRRSVEMSLIDFWSSLKEVVQEAIKCSGAQLSEIRAVSYSSQANSIILMDENLRALTPIIIWNDQSGEVIEELKQFTEVSEWMNVSGIGCGVSYGLTFAKVCWLQKRFPKMWKKVKYIKTLPDYLTFELTDLNVIDSSTASLSGLLDSKNEIWWGKALNFASIDKSLLPVVERIGTSLGKISISGARRLGISFNTDYVLGGLDHHMAAIGNELRSTNEISESTGTVMAVVQRVDKYEPKSGIFTGPSDLPGDYFSLAFDENGASTLEWYHKTFANTFSLDKLVEQASCVANGCDGLFALPCAKDYEGLNGFINIKPIHHHGHFARAIMESTARSLGSIIKKLGAQRDYVIVSTGGGSKINLWSEVKRDILQIQILISNHSEAACRGAAIIAARSIQD